MTTYTNKMATFIKLQHAYNYVDIKSKNKTVARGEIFNYSIKTSNLKINNYFLCEGFNYFIL